jgi:hypothetical protein
MIVMGVDLTALDSAEWLQPGTYSVWAYFRSGDDENPLLFVAYEWAHGGLRGVRVDGVWLHDGETKKEWEADPEFEAISEGVEAASFARLVENGKVHRIGVMPSMGRFVEPPGFLN